MRPNVRRSRSAAAVFVLVMLSFPVFAQLPEAPPSELGFDPAKLHEIDAAVNRAIEAKTIPGAVVAVGRRGRLAFVRAYGRRAIVPEAEPMTRDSVFDLASLTKPIATASSVLILVDRGKLSLDDTLGKLLPEFSGGGKAGITVEQLLRHRAGLIADNPLSDYANGPETAWKRLADLRTTAEPGSRFVYSDVGYILLGKIVEKVSGQTLHEFTTEALFDPLGMTGTGYQPGLSGRVDIKKVAPTEPIDGKMTRGVVHDPRAGPWAARPVTPGCSARPMTSPCSAR